jgi:hypothetical protein
MSRPRARRIPANARDAVEVAEFSRKHTANVHDSLREIRRLVEGLVERRNARRDGFVDVMRKAMGQKLGGDADEVLKVLNERGISKKLAKEALEIARQRGGFTIFALVDALSRLAGRVANAGESSEADTRASALLALAA